jgi:hypothetical protein
MSAKPNQPDQPAAAPPPALPDDPAVPPVRVNGEMEESERYDGAARPGFAPA